MSGVKGRSGGPRKNAGGARANSGGKRPGAGRPPAPPVVRELDEAEEAEKFLLSVINDQGADLRLRLDAAKALLPFQKPKLGEVGKKDAKKEAAQAASARFSIPAPPRLTLVKSA